ncbi:hypothetical protein GPECTOR_41g661 [Gonium pectorale]|uniref:Uncharacterized protein n=1 Tax=Gonium pectorale TaxID=33097 RepID=A0A150GA21_GONPE|nr:hypothetical protein GPECTOR_41g661 [Gonium pectorale]|eukprot:KXZ46697.1 hypothetical protein GPECTOR_41g661 [Gonium pectorale]
MITDVVEMVAEMMSLMEQMEMSGDLARRDVVEMVAEMMSLMEQMEMSGDLARRVRKALRQLQAADKERFIRIHT